MNDLSLVIRSRNGDVRATDDLVRRHDPLANAIAADFFHLSLTHDDLLQHARIGLLAAIRNYRISHGVPFDRFAALCIRREVINALKAARREKHTPLNTAVTTTVTLDDGATVDLLDVLPGAGHGPAEVVELRDRIGRMVAAMHTLSALERRWLAVAANDGVYHRRATGSKTAENAVERARRKLRDAA